MAFLGIGVVKGFDSHITTPLLLLGITSALFSGLAYNCIRKVKDTDHPLVVVFYFPLIATPIMAIISIYSWVTPVGIEWLLLLLVGILTQVAQVNMTKALQSAEINAVISLKYVGIIFALGFDVLIFGVQYNYLALIGISLVLSGVIGNVLLKKYFAKNPKSSTDSK